MITTSVTLHTDQTDHGVDRSARFSDDGMLHVSRTETFPGGMTGYTELRLYGTPESVIAELDRMRLVVLDAISAARTAELLADDFAHSADAAHETALAYADAGF